ncbi:MAG: hypothetical protein GY786_12885 [Proteobacteria bacterium]|nr:hypothetical protein [Pseudomonadota bacterium]
MNRKLGILLMALLFTLTAWGESFYTSAYRTDAKDLKNFVKSQLKLLYSDDEDKREETLDKVKEASRQSLKEGDSFFPFKILGDFVLSSEAPGKLASDEDYMDEIKSLQEQALEFLIDEAKDEDLNISGREFVVHQLSRIVSADSLPKFSWNEDSMELLDSMSKDDNGILRHAAVVGVKKVALKTEDKWSSLSEKAAEVLVRDIGNDDLVRQRISYLESINVLSRAQVNNDATEKIWEMISEDLEDIKSPQMQERISDKVSNLISIKLGAVFQDQVNEAKENLDDIESQKKLSKEPVTDLLELLKEEEDPIEIEAAIDRLVNESRKNRSLAYIVYSGIIGITSNLEIQPYKLRLLHGALIRMTHSIKSSLFYYRTALFFLSEISVHKQSAKANIPLIMLGNLLSSTDHPSLVLPVLEEISHAADSNLPMWIKRRLVTVIFLQAGDSPSRETGMGAAKYLTSLAENSGNIAIKWEAITRVNFLAKFAKDEAVKKYSANWH